MGPLAGSRLAAPRPLVVSDDRSLAQPIVLSLEAIMLALRLVALALGTFRPFSQDLQSHERADRPRMGRVIPRQCYARIIADVQDASPFPCANWILRQFPGGQRPFA